jgi:branched-chain amino acid transport system substrate-binding protein
VETERPDWEKVRDAIENMKGFVGTDGIFNFSPADHNGLGVNSFTMVIVNEGKFVPFAFSMLNNGGKFVPVGN